MVTSMSTESKVVDPGLDESIKKLTHAKIEQVVNHVLDNETSARLKAYIETCVHCGLCAEACHTYLSRDKDPQFSPVAKVKNTIWELVKRKGKVDGEFLRNMARIAFTECAVCRRCSMYCPFGIDLAYLLLVVRRMCNLLGVVPQYLQDTTNSHAATLNQMWVQQDDWIDALLWQDNGRKKMLKQKLKALPSLWKKKALKSCTRLLHLSLKFLPS